VKTKKVFVPASLLFDEEKEFNIIGTCLTGSGIVEAFFSTKCWNLQTLKLTRASSAFTFIARFRDCSINRGFPAIGGKTNQVFDQILKIDLLQRVGENVTLWLFPNIENDTRAKQKAQLSNNDIEYQ
jgi:hypothetical protein